jgi:hypothetical protein
VLLREGEQTGDGLRLPGGLLIGAEGVQVPQAGGDGGRLQW